MGTKTQFAVRFLTDDDVPFRTCDDPRRRPRRPAAVPAPAPAPDLDLDAAARERADAIRREHGPVPAALTERVAALLRAQSATERRTA